MDLTAVIDLRRAMGKEEEEEADQQRLRLT